MRESKARYLFETSVLSKYYVLNQVLLGSKVKRKDYINVLIEAKENSFVDHQGDQNDMKLSQGSYEKKITDSVMSAFSFYFPFARF